MKHFLLHNRMVISGITVGLIAIGIIVLLCVPLSWATDLGFFGPPAEFINSSIVIRTDTGTSILSIRLVDFLMGIQTDKSWEKKSETFWILKTGFTDPVTEKHKTYVLEFEKAGHLIVLSSVSLDNRMLAYQEMVNFANQIIDNFKKHLSTK